MQENITGLLQMKMTRGTIKRDIHNFIDIIDDRDRNSLQTKLHHRT